MYVGGVNVKDYDLDALRKEVSIVLQKNVLFSGTIKENLRWGDENATDEELVRASPEPIPYSSNPAADTDITKHAKAAKSFEAF